MRYYALAFLALPAMAAALDLSRAVVVVNPNAALPEKTAATVLVEEVEKRTGLHLTTATSAPSGATSIQISSGTSGIKAEGFHISARNQALNIAAADPRGAIFGVGYFLRKADFAKGRLSIDDHLDITTSPAYPIRGHQLGYRTQANSYDAWSAAQFEQYIRELAFFGANSVEGIPFEDKRPTAVMKFPRRDMNRAISEICYRYGLDYWVWVPADFDLKDTTKRAALLGKFAESVQDGAELTGVFVPGGDPGSNQPELVMPFLEDLASAMKTKFPKAKVWLSLQQFSKAQEEYVYRYIEQKRPSWLGGLVAGPSSPPVAVTRLRLDKQYQIRLYPDLTHNKISQYQVPSWDQAYALTLGREAVNPRPEEMAIIHNWFAPYSDGFISYSDGVHDDLNKTIFSALSWDPSAKPRDIVVDYAHAYFGSSIAVDSADAILALEKNWRGVLADNGAVEGTLLMWQRLEKQAPELESNWRWQMCLLRANYDAWVRRRLLRETVLEDEANAVMAQATIGNADQALERAAAILDRVMKTPTSPELHSRIEVLCEELFKSIGLQSSVPKYFASGAERGAVLDFIDYPLNNRWYLEDEFAKIRQLGNETAKVKRLRELGTWEHPTPDSFYDNVGSPAKSPHVFRADTEMIEPGDERRPEPTFWWWDQGKSRARLSWQATMWPRMMAYEGLDPNGVYFIRTSGYGQCLLKINGERVMPTIDGKLMGEVKEFPVSPQFLKNRKLVLTFDRPQGEEKLNWRQHSRLSEVWLIKR